MASTEALSNLDRTNYTTGRVDSSVESGASAVSWGAIIAGATAAAAMSMILLALGMGLGLSSISPWAQKGVQASTFGFASIAWITVTQLSASALGGYLAGRLRTRWASVHSDEVYFRDTAHGLIAWAVAALTSAVMLVSVAANTVGTAAQVGATLATGVTAAGVAAASSSDMSSSRSNDAGNDSNGPMGYLVDSLFRADATVAPVNAVNTGNGLSNTQGMEVTRIFLNAVGSPNLPQQDVSYLGQLVTQRTGLSKADAERRVVDTYTALQTSVSNAKRAAVEAADKARKLAIQASLWIFIGLLGGAFIASYTATLGGRERDA